ncbi:MAG: type II CAAX endopeptidase family protein [Balneolaceae bacterium]|nr:type II CAAX endopeptidase family protein [Balneolaceae bacterium]
MNLFYNPDEKRLRAGWRLFLQFVLMLALLAAGQVMLGLLGSPDGFLFDRIFSAFAFIVSTWVAARYLDGRSFHALGISLSKKWMRELGMGMAIGGLAIAFIFLLHLLAGWIDFTGYGWQRGWNQMYPLPLFSYLLGMLLVGFYEELVFRGYQITNMIEGFASSQSHTRYSVVGAILLSSSIFGILHAGNPNSSIISTINIMFAGVVLALPYLITGSLALSAGLHAAWNFFQGGIFGLPVSGTSARSSLLQVRETGPDLFTGGQFGPEAGLTGIMGMFLIVLLVYQYTRSAGYAFKLHDKFIHSAE